MDLDREPRILDTRQGLRRQASESPPARDERGGARYARSSRRMTGTGAVEPNETVGEGGEGRSAFAGRGLRAGPDFHAEPRRRREVDPNE